jgi:hypothetical protein
MRIETIAGKRFILSELLMDWGCVHAFGTRDLGPRTGPAHAAIRAAFPEVQAIAGVHQEHDLKAARVLPGDDLAALRRSPADIVIVRDPGIAASVRTADCAPILLFDPRVRAAAAIHAGWKGTVVRAAAEAVRILVAEYGARLPDLRAAIGPCIGPCHYQVDEPVIAGIETALSDLAPLALTPDGPGKARLDLSLANRFLLQDAGLDPRLIEEARLCTLCNPELFYSYRRQGQSVPSLHHFIGLKG